MKPALPPHLENNVVFWDDHEARFHFAAGFPGPPGLVGRWFWPFLPLLISSFAWVLMADSDSPHKHVLAGMGFILFAAGALASLSLFRKTNPWEPWYNKRWRDSFWRSHEVRFNFDRGEVRDGDGSLFGHFKDLELAIHVGQCFGESMFTVTVPGNPDGNGWYLAVLDGSNFERTFLGPGTLSEMEEIGLSFLRQYPFQRIRNYVATIRGKDGKERPTTTYEVVR